MMGGVDGRGRTFCHYQISAGPENLAIDIIVGGRGPELRTPDPSHTQGVAGRHLKAVQGSPKKGRLIQNPPSIRCQEPWLTLGQFTSHTPQIIRYKWVLTCSYS